MEFYFEILIIILVTFIYFYFKSYLKRKSIFKENKKLEHSTMKGFKRLYFLFIIVMIITILLKILK